jgi:hypothetical protein
MHIFYLEDNPDAYGPITKYLRNNKHTVLHARNLKGAAFLLELDPGTDYFDLFLFDVGLPSEEVKYQNINKGIVTYSHPERFNGLLFLLHNLDILGDRASKITILTAYKKQVIDMDDIDVFGRKFIRKMLSPEEDQARYEQEQVTKIRYTDYDTSKTYTISILDKVSDIVISQIKRFINRG